MEAWANLVKKELMLGRKFFYGVLIGIVGIAVLGIILSLYFPIGAISAAAVLMSFALVGYLFIYLIVSIVQEKATLSLWMQMPLKGWKLLSAKLTAGFICMVVTSAVTLILAYVMLQVDNGRILDYLVEYHIDLSAADLADLQMLDNVIRFFHDHYLQLAASIFSFLPWVGLLAGSILLFAYMIKRSLQRYLGRWSVLATLIILITGSILYRLVMQDLGLFHLFDWGHIQLDLPDSFIFEGSMKARDINGIHEMMSIGELVRNILFSGVLIWVSGWLLDKKVEV